MYFTPLILCDWSIKYKCLWVFFFFSLWGCREKPVIIAIYVTAQSDFQVEFTIVLFSAIAKISIAQFPDMIHDHEESALASVHAIHV